MSELRAEVKRIVPVNDAEADRLIALYRSHRPAESLGDIAAVMAGDASALRYSAYLIARRKHAQGRAPVFLYAFTWRSPVRQGKLRSMHCVELPFVFDHPDAISFMTGSGADRYALATAMSEAWVSFARTGNPSHAGIPRWTPFEPASWPTMVFGPQVALVGRPARRRAKGDGGGASWCLDRGPVMGYATHMRLGRMARGSQFPHERHWGSGAGP